MIFDIRPILFLPFLVPQIFWMNFFAISDCSATANESEVYPFPIEILQTRLQSQKRSSLSYIGLFNINDLEGQTKDFFSSDHQIITNVASLLQCNFTSTQPPTCTSVRSKAGGKEGGKGYCIGVSPPPPYSVRGRGAVMQPSLSCVFLLPAYRWHYSAGFSLIPKLL